jgi:2-amino-4-hydroxy-6-hydroxymethyldihydropteridine diphosphokinase
MPTSAWISLGSNLGDRRAILDAAVVALAEVPGVSVLTVSSYYETKPIGGPPGQGSFLNAATHLKTTLDPHQLLAVLQRIENEAGRIRTVRWGERTLDLDILIFGTRFLDTRELKLPHPRLAFRRFVLEPLAEIAPNIVDTMTMRSIIDLLANLDRKPMLLAFEGPDGALKSTLLTRLVAELPALGLVERDLVRHVEPPFDHLDDEFKRFEARASALSRDDPSLADRSIGWVITDFCFLFEESRMVAARLRSIHQLQSQPESQEATRTIYAKIRELQQFIRNTWPPTFAVLLPGTDQRRIPGQASFPLLEPEQNEPEALVDEIIATCHGFANG